MRTQNDTSSNLKLNATHLAFGIRRKATDEELHAYLKAGADAQPIDLDEAFAKYRRQNPTSSIRHPKSTNL